MAPVSSTVLIEGESGTGKELVARAIAPLESAREQAVHRRERRRAAGVAARERAVRPREGRVHRRRRAAARALRARRTAARSSSTRSARSRRPRRSSCCACSRSGSSCASAARSRSRWTCASSPRRTGRCASAWRAGDFRADLYYRLNVLRDLSAAAARAARRHPAARAPLHPGVLGAARPRLPRHLGRGDADAHRLSVAGQRARAAEPRREHGRAVAGARDHRRATSRAQIREGGSARFLPVHGGSDGARAGRSRRAGARVHRAQPAGAQAAGGGAAPADGRRSGRRAASWSARCGRCRRSAGAVSAVPGARAGARRRRRTW